MRELTMDEMMRVDGGDFWSGVACGLGLVGSFVAVVSPDPLSKVALLTYGGTLISCALAY